MVVSVYALWIKGTNRYADLRELPTYITFNTHEHIYQMYSFNRYELERFVGNGVVLIRCDLAVDRMTITEYDV